MKNLCKVCIEPVTDKTGQRCEGVCRKWIHYNCLSFSPDKIEAIRKGIIKINCPCPNCEGNKKDHHARKCGTISGYCGKSKCPGMAKVDSELKCSSSPAPEEAHNPSVNMETEVLENSLASTPLEDTAASTHSLDSKVSVTSRGRHRQSPIRKHQPTSPIRTHTSTCMSAQCFQNTIVHKSTSVQIFSCPGSCAEMCSGSSPEGDSDTEEKECPAAKHARRDEPLEESSNVRCPYCLTKIVLGGIPRRLYNCIQNQQSTNDVVECSKSEDDVSPCFEYSKFNKSTKEQSLTQKFMDKCIRRSKYKCNAVQTVSSVTSMHTNTSNALEASDTLDNSTSTHSLLEDRKSEDELYDNFIKPNALGSILTQISANMEEMRLQFKTLLQYFSCQKCSV